MLRRSRARLAVLGFLILGLVAYHVWSWSGRHIPSAPLQPHLGIVREYGPDGTERRLVAIQPYMVPGDYASESTLESKLDSYFREAANRHWLGRKSVVVLPEYLGSWLVVAGEKTKVYSARDTDQATTLLAVSALPSVLYNAVRSPSPDWRKYAVFRTKGRQMAEIYDSVLSGLAREYGVTIIGGSIVLPSPSVRKGRLTAGTGALYSVCPVYRPDGLAEPSLVTKVFLTKDEQPWQKPGMVEDLPVFDTPAGRIGVLICADSWFPEAYRVMAAKGAQAVVVPSYANGDNKRDATWAGYSGHDEPEDVEKSDLDSITESQAWTKYALAGRLPRAGIPDGLIVHLRGRLWELGSDGSTVLVSGGRRIELPDDGKAAIVSLRLSDREK